MLKVLDLDAAKLCATFKQELLTLTDEELQEEYNQHTNELVLILIRREAVSRRLRLKEKEET